MPDQPRCFSRYVGRAELDRCRTSYVEKSAPLPISEEISNDEFLIGVGIELFLWAGPDLAEPKSEELDVLLPSGFFGFFCLARREEYGRDCDGEHPESTWTEIELHQWPSGQDFPTRLERAGAIESPNRLTGPRTHQIGISSCVFATANARQSVKSVLRESIQPLSGAS